MKKVWNWFVEKKPIALYKWKSAFLNRSDKNIKRENIKPMIGGSDDQLALSRYRTNNGTSDSLDIMFQQSSSAIFPPLNDDFEEFFDESANAIEVALEKKVSFPLRPTQSKTEPACQSYAEKKNINNMSTRDRRKSEPINERPRRPIYKSTSEEELSGKEEPASNDAKQLESFDSDPFKAVSQSVKMKRRGDLPLVSVSFADEPASSTAFNRDVIEDINFPDLNCFSRKYATIKAPYLDENESQPSKSTRSQSPSDDLQSGLSENERRLTTCAQRRQSTMQVVQSLSGRRTSTTLVPLTSAQIHLVRALWRQVYMTKGPTVIGSTLFHRLFFKSLRTKDLFRRCSLPQQFANHDTFFKAHAKATGELIDQIVENLENLEKISDTLVNIGSMHAQLIGDELPRKLWNMVAETFIDCTLEWGDKRCRSETVRKAWALIIAFVIEKIKEGHTQARISLIRRGSVFP